MSPSTTRAHVVRAALESIGYIVTDVLKAMSEDSGIILDTIYADGGAVRNAFLMQFVADLNQLKVRAAQTPELSALGAVYSGCLGQKIYSSLEDLANLQSGFIDYFSSMSAANAEEKFSGWQAAVAQVLHQPKQG
jgi:glycerol kinase